MEFFEVAAKCGHVGKKRYYRGLFYVRAENGKAAAAIVRMMPRVKHNRKDAIIAVTKINYAVYKKGNAAHHQNPYFDCHNNQEMQLVFAEIAEDIYYETYEININKCKSHNISDRKAKRNAMLRYYRKMDKYYGHNIGA
jgi:hypothetical protein